MLAIGKQLSLEFSIADGVPGPVGGHPVKWAECPLAGTYRRVPIGQLQIFEGFYASLEVDGRRLW
jgi:hypothetical protein